MLKPEYRVENPCFRDCPDRTPTCHGKCEKYQAYAKWCEEVRQKRAEKSRARNILNEGKDRMFRKKLLREKQGRK